jgi:hypothetical protein
MGAPGATINTRLGGQHTSAARPSWYAAFTCPRHEKSGARHQDREIPCFLPVYRAVERWKERRKELELVLFPSHVFSTLS